MVGRIWDSTMTLAILGLVLFVWFELSNDIQDNANAIADIRVEMAKEMSAIRVEMAAGFAKLENMLVREVYTNRENIYDLEQRLSGLEGGSP